MAKIKLTKNELKAQRDAMKRYQRYLPTLQLKKQQLQMEVMKLRSEVEAKRKEEEKAREELAPWVALFSENIDFTQYLKVVSVKKGEGNIVGVNIPVFDGVEFDRNQPDLYETPVWVDDGIKMLEKLISLRLERSVIEEQHRLLEEELRTTNQRVNLFEKVKIPECKNNIRKIRIFLGDEQTAGVARAKIAKSKSVSEV